MPGRSKSDGVPTGSGPLGNSHARGNSGGGAPRQNTNAMTHGSYHFMATGKLPPAVQDDADDFARRLGAAVRDRYGNDTPFDIECLQQTANANYCVALCRAHWTGEDLSITEKDRLWTEALACLDKRDSKVQEMNLRDENDEGEIGTWANVHFRPGVNVGSTTPDTGQSDADDPVRNGFAVGDQKSTEEPPEGTSETQNQDA